MEENKYFQELFLVISKHILDQITSNECPLECPFLTMRQLTNKKDRLGNLSMTWIIRIGATRFEPAT